MFRVSENRNKRRSRNMKARVVTTLFAVVALTAVALAGAAPGMNW